MVFARPYSENYNMRDTDTRAQRDVDGGVLYMRRRPDPGARWEINFWEELIPVVAPLGMFLRTHKLWGHHFAGQTFGTPDEAAQAVHQVLAA
jgi:hypothetical protein